VTSYFEAFKNLLFPPLCLGCSRRLGSSRPPLFCADCFAEIAFIHSPCCRCCGIPFSTGADHLCGDCLTNHYAFDLARSLFYYRPPVSAVLRSLKFKGHLSGIATLAVLTAQSDLMPLFAEPDWVIPVPLHVSRLRERGFNQALVIAGGCFPQWKHRITSALLRRSRATLPQTLLTGKQRRINLKKVFSLYDTSPVVGKRILLVDAVFTTGSTVNECSKVLRSAGAARIEVFTLARSLPQKGSGYNQQLHTGHRLSE
jgi:ComF family protein